MIHHEKTRVLSLIHHHQRLAIVVTILLSFLGVILAIVVINYSIFGGHTVIPSIFSPMFTSGWAHWSPESNAGSSDVLGLCGNPR
jgi:hypothetical protein